MWQVALDLPSAGSVPWGFGHLYSAGETVNARAAVTSPSGWDASQLAALGTALDQELSSPGDASGGDARWHLGSRLARGG